MPAKFLSTKELKDNGLSIEYFAPSKHKPRRRKGRLQHTKNANFCFKYYIKKSFTKPDGSTTTRVIGRANRLPEAHRIARIYLRKLFTTVVYSRHIARK